MKTIANLPQKLSRARQLSIGSYCAFLVVLVTAGLLDGQPLSLLIFTLVPLLIFIPTLISENYKGLSLLCFVILMYFMVTVVNLFGPDNSPLDFVELLLEVIMFNAAMMFSRWKQYSLYQ